VKDIQIQLDLLEAGHAAFCDASHFVIPAGYQAWTSQETEDLVERRTYFVGLSQNRIGDRGDIISEGSSAHGHGKTSFTFIPPDPRRFYLALLRRCLEIDLDDMANLSDNDMVSLAILSEPHIALLDEVAGHWRISKSTKLTAHAGLLVDLLHEDGVPVECVAETLTKLRYHIQQTDQGSWLREDVSQLATILQLRLNLARHRLPSYLP
jgi:hypothetical protein